MMGVAGRGGKWFTLGFVTGVVKSRGQVLSPRPTEYKGDTATTYCAQPPTHTVPHPVLRHAEQPAQR